MVLTRGGVPPSSSWRFGPSQRGQVEERSSVGIQHEDDPRSSPPRSPAFILDAIQDERDADSIQALLCSAASVRTVVSLFPLGKTSPRGRQKRRHNKARRSQTNPGRVAVAGSSRGGVTKFARNLPNPQQALLRSQGGPLASAPFLCMPVDRVFRIDSQPFRILLLRRLRMPLLLTVHSCRCGRLLDSLGHHR